MTIIIESNITTEEQLLERLKKCHGDGRNWPMTKGFRSRKDQGLIYTTYNPYYLTAYDGKTPIGYAGFKDNGSFIVSAGTHVHPDYQKKGIATKLIQKRNTIYDSMNKPALLTLGPKTMSLNLWKSKFAKTGWIDAPQYSNLDEKTIKAIPEDVYEYHRRKYVDRLMLYPTCITGTTKEQAIL